MDLLAEYGDSAKLLAGGQSLVPLLALRLARPDHLIDINRIGAMSFIDDSNGLRIGALVRQRVAERSSTVAATNPLLAGALRYIGHAAIRNRGTIAGSIAHADPAAELPTILTVLDGEVEATSGTGTRTVRASELFEGFLTTSLAPEEVVTAVRFPPWKPGAGWSFQEFSRRSGDFAVAGAVAVLQLNDNGLIAEARIALSGMGATPLRVINAETALLNQMPSDALWRDVAGDAVPGLEPPSDLHGTAAYRRYLAATLIRRALYQAHERAKENT